MYASKSIRVATDVGGTFTDMVVFEIETDNSQRVHTAKVETTPLYFENGVLKSEAEAWEFALDNSLIEPSEEDRDMMLQCIMSYVRGAEIKHDQLSRLYNGNRHHHAFYYDQRTVFVDNIIKRIKGI